MSNKKLNIDDILNEEIEEVQSLQKADEKEKNVKELERKVGLFGQGRPVKKENEKSRNKIVLYFTDEEINRIEEACLLDGMDLKSYKKYAKKALLKTIRREVGGV